MAQWGSTCPVWVQICVQSLVLQKQRNKKLQGYKMKYFMRDKVTGSFEEVILS